MPVVWAASVAVASGLVGLGWILARRVAAETRRTVDAVERLGDLADELRGLDHELQSFRSRAATVADRREPSTPPVDRTPGRAEPPAASDDRAAGRPRRPR